MLKRNSKPWRTARKEEKTSRLSIGKTFAITSIRQKSIELYFPNDKNKNAEEAQNCTINIPDASGVLVNKDKLLSTILKERGVYTSKFYLVLHSYFEIFNSDFSEHDVYSICYYQIIARKCAFCFSSVLEMERSSYSSATMVNSQQSNKKLSLDYDHGDFECFFARDTTRSQEESLTAPLSANKPHEGLPNSPIHEIESDNASEIVSFPSGITSNLPVSVSSVSSIPVFVLSVSIPSEGTSSINNTQSNAPNISNEGPMQLTDLTASENVNVKKIIVHRQKLRLDLVEAFETVSISDTIRFIIVNARGEKEPGVCAGCERDITSSAWK